MALSTATPETQDVLLYVAYLVVFVIVLEYLLHSLEHAIKRHRKYAEMLHKTTQELMIVGLIYLMVKFCLYVGLVEKGGLAYQAMDAADILVFFLAIALVLQATVVFLRLRRTNHKMDRISIISAQDLVAEAEAKRGQQWNCLYRLVLENRYEERMQLKILGHFFLRMYELPKLFSFPKYIREVQDSQIAHLIHIDITMWLVLFAIYAAFFGCTGELLTHSAYRSSARARIPVFAIFGLSLMLGMTLLLVYLRWLVNKLLGHAFKVSLTPGSAGKDPDMGEFANLKQAMLAIVKEEAETPKLTTDAAIDQMKHVQEDLTDALLSHGHHGDTHGGCFTHDLLLQLLRSGFRRLVHRGHRRQPKGNTLTAKLTKRGADQQLRLPFFSRKLVHFLMQLFLIVNGFYAALLLNCVMYIDGLSVATALRVVGLALPLVVNAVLLAPKIVRQFSLVSGAWMVEPKKLSGVIEHFTEVADMKKQMVTQIMTYLHSRSLRVKNLEEALAKADAADDDANDGFIHTEDLRQVLKDYGFTFSRHKFHTLVRLEFDTKGKTIRYKDLLRLFPEDADDATTDDSSKLQVPPAANDFSYEEVVAV
ncbi:hypothetical protein ACHHYP_08962 [Achlya hypogyna]|uniref:EF-hand domain-containing protein n=1 Tax=Achlya hypogyna TaxID=1202772 RepID=A0A1V9YNT1_ACHHY|nr:hypothetical protein ACHHYP_08962 [Achlya hypogyna]